MKTIYIILFFACAPFVANACAVQVQHTNELCNGDCNATAQAFPIGQAPYTYMWMPGNLTTQSVSGLCAGSYTLVVIDANNCTATAVFSITQPTSIVSTHTSTNVLCNGGCNGTAAVAATGGTPGYTYSWSPSGGTASSATSLCPVSYTCTITDANGCTNTQSVTITQPNPITMTTTSIAASCSTCCDGSAAVTNVNGGVPPYTYNWIPSGGNGPSATNLCTGSYSCCITDANNCTFCSTVTVTFTTGIQTQSSNENLSVFPSPANDFVNVKESFENSTSAMLSISNVLGETVFTKSVSTNSELNETINVSDFTSGIYFITVKTSMGTSVKRFVKE